MFAFYLNSFYFKQILILILFVKFKLCHTNVIILLYSVYNTIEGI